MTKSPQDIPVSVLLKNLAQHFAGSHSVSLGQIKEALHERGFCLLLIIFSVPCVLPLPAISLVGGLILMLISIQMLLGRDSPWMPEWLCRKQVETASLNSMIVRLLPYLEKIESRIKPRFFFANAIIAEKLVGIIVLIFAIYITLPVVFGNTLPSIGIIALALGLLSRDGLMIIIGTIIGLVGVLMASLVIFIGLEALKMLLSHALLTVKNYI